MILIKNLNKSFKKRILFENLNLELPSNKLVFIVGKSGIGKSTLLKLISGYEKQDSGTIDFVGYKNLDFKNIDFVFQDFNLIKGLSVLENLQVGVNVLGIEFDKQKALEILEKLEISFQLSKQKIESLSGGEQQRVAIARSILRNSQILLTDEPTGNLDFENSETIFEYLKEISKAKTVIVVTHDIENAKKYGDYIVKIEEDNILQYYIGNSSENEQQFYSNEIQTPILETKHKLKLIPKFVKNDIKRRIIQLFFLLFAFVATVVSFGSFIQLQNGIQARATKISASYLQADKILVIKDYDDSSINGDFFPKDIDLFKNLPDLKYWTETYQYEGARISYNSNITKSAIDFEFIDFNDFYKNRMIDNISLGSFPTNDNEIIISENLVKGLNIVNPIGKTVLYHDESDDSDLIEKLKIVAVNNITNLTGKNLTFISNNFIKKIDQINLSKMTRFSLAIPGKTITNQSKTFFTTVYNNIYEGKWRILENLDPKSISDDNIKVDNDLPSIYIGKNIVDANKLKINDKIFVAVGPKQIAFRLAGIINTKEKGVVALTRSFNKQFTTPSPNQLSLYFNDNVNTTTLAKELLNKPEYKKFLLSSNRSNFASQFRANISNTVYVLKIIAGALFLISILFILGFTKIFNDFKKREIGLLKSLGSSLKQILIYHFSYYLIINILVLILSLILLVPISHLIISFYDNSSNIGFDYSAGFASIFIIWSVNLGVTTFIFMLFSFFKFRRKISYLLK